MIGAFEPRRETVGTFVDEIGIEIGIYGDWRLKAEFRPVFAFAEDSFHPVAVEGSARPFVFGRVVEERMFRRAVPPRDRPIVSGICSALCLRNLPHTGVEGLKLLLSADFGTAVSAATVHAAARALAAEARRSDFPAADLYVDVSRLADIGEHALPAAFEGLRAGRIGVALSEKGDGIAFTGLPHTWFPDLVAIDGGWFRAIVRQPSTAHLFGALVHGYRAQGAIVLVQGIATAAELRVALDAGADWLSGPLLAPAALAGAIFPDGPRPIGSLLDERRVIPLFR